MIEEDIQNNINILQSTASQILSVIVQSRNNIFFLHGPDSEDKKKEEYPPTTEIHITDKENDTRDYYVDSDSSVFINTNNSNSFIISGNVNSMIIIESKINHLILRKCKNVSVYLGGGTVSGINIVQSDNVRVYSLGFNHITVEFSGNIAFNSNLAPYDKNSISLKEERLDPELMIVCVGCDNITFNSKKLHVNILEGGSIFGIDTETGLLKKKFIHVLTSCDVSISNSYTQM